MKGFLRKLQMCGLVILALLSFAAMLVHAVYTRNEQKAAALLNAVQLFWPGQSSDVDVERIVATYHGGRADISGLACDPHGPSYMVHIANETLNSLGRRYSFLPTLQPREVNAIFILKNGKLCYVQYYVDTWPGNHFRPIRTTATVTLASETAHPEFDVRYIGGNIFTLKIALTSEATLQQRHQAFDFSLSCLQRFTGCQEACELMPSAWLAHQNELRDQGLTSALANEPQCKNSE